MIQMKHASKPGITKQLDDGATLGRVATANAMNPITADSVGQMLVDHLMSVTFGIITFDSDYDLTWTRLD